MQIYLVGGAVRDALLGKQSKDRDFVVTGATAADMLKKGFQQVGADFPVFLHPNTGEEYALARTERKTGAGYLGFTTDFSKNVSLEDDLKRRDLTINAMAVPVKPDGTINLGDLIDPYHGKKDLQEKIFRHVSEAFAEDPVRVLRVARFHARYGTTWTIAAETKQLMQSLVDKGELNHLTAERVWKELSRGLTEPSPQLMLMHLTKIGAFDKPAFQEFKGFNPDDKLQLARVESQTTLATRFYSSFPLAEFSKQSVVPSDIKQIHGISSVLEENFKEPLLAPANRLAVLEKTGCLRQPEKLDEVKSLFFGENRTKVEMLQKDLKTILTLDNRQIIGNTTNGQEIKSKIQAARVAALTNQPSRHGDRFL